MRLYNSLTKQIEKFQPISNKKVLIYVCGITPYDTTHLGHAFTYISFDILVRYLLFKGYKIKYTQNVTDINDRDTDLLEHAREQNVLWSELANFWTKRFLSDMKNLNWRMPDNYLHASEQIDKMIQIILLLLKKGHAYRVKGNVFLDITRFPQYGNLSRFKELEMLKVAKEFEEDLDNPLKKHRLDITLWRASTLSQPKHIPSFDSPFGKGRPGWHIECSAMAISSLNDQIDIHGGGGDLKFPHHEAEIVQSEGVTNKKPFAKYWLHTGEVRYKGAKMSKSLGNLILVSDILKKYSPNAIRWMLLSHHYRENWEFKESDIEKAASSVILVSSALENASKISYKNNTRDYDTKSDEVLKEFTKLMDNDVQTPEVLNYVLNLAQENPKNARIIAPVMRTLGFRI